MLSWDNRPNETRRFGSIFNLQCYLLHSILWSDSAKTSASAMALSFLGLAPQPELWPAMICLRQPTAQALIWSRSSRNWYVWLTVVRWTTNQHENPLMWLPRKSSTENGDYGDDRKNQLTTAGYDYNTVQAKVNELLGQKAAPTSPSKKSNDVIAQEVINGK